MRVNFGCFFFFIIVLHSEHYTLVSRVSKAVVLCGTFKRRYSCLGPSQEFWFPEVRVGPRAFVFRDREVLVCSWVRTSAQDTLLLGSQKVHLGQCLPPLEV